MRERRSADEHNTHRRMGAIGDLKDASGPSVRDGRLASFLAVPHGSVNTHFLIVATQGVGAFRTCVGRTPRLRRLAHWGVLLLGLFVLASGGRVLPAQAQTSEVCERALSAAEDQYRDAEFDEALRLVSACLDQGEKSQAQAVAAYRLLALIHLKRDELEQARAAVVNLLGVDPTYEADPVNSPPAYVSLVAIVQRNLQTSGEVAAADEPERTPFFRRTGTWVTIGTIVVGSGVASYFALGGGGGEGETVPPSGSPNPLPLPPGTP